MFILEEYPSIASQYIAELRNVNIQTDRLRFRRNLERIGEVLAYEMSKQMAYQIAQVETPLGISAATTLRQQPVLATVLRAGMPMFQGVLNFFDRADSAFVGAYRGAFDDENNFEIDLHYKATPELEGRDLVLIDPMLATGKSLVKAYKALANSNKPDNIYVLAAIAAPEGVKYLKQEMPGCIILLGALDQGLNEKSYILPGLGDAGDLAFGPKC